MAIFPSRECQEGDCGSEDERVGTSSTFHSDSEMGHGCAKIHHVHGIDVHGIVFARYPEW